MLNTIGAADFSKKTVVVRADLNVPLDRSGTVPVVADDTRIRAAIPTLKHIVDNGGKAVVLSHLGRPKGNVDPALSLRPVAEHLAGLVDCSVSFCSHTGAERKDHVGAVPWGSVVILENTRFDAREKANDPTLASEFAELGSVFVNDAFGTAHRAHASTVGVAHLSDEKYLGLLMEKEVSYLSKLLDNTDNPFVAILGGAKVSDKIGIIRNLLPKVEHLLIGGAMSYTFLAASGVQVGTSLVEEDKFEQARQLRRAAGSKLLIPTDHVVATTFDNDAESKTVEGDIPDGWMGLDIGPETRRTYSAIIEQAKTVVWNGPMGVFEFANFARGTLAIAQAMADSTKSGALTIVGGGDSVAAISQAELDDDVSHVSTGGGAMLEFLEGKDLPGLAAIASS